MTDNDENLTREIGRRLRGARQEAGLSLSQLCARTDGLLSKSRVSNYEQGIRRLGVEEARILAEALGSVSPAHLLCVEETVQLSVDEQRLITYYRALTPTKQAAVRQFTRTDGGEGATG